MSATTRHPSFPHRPCEDTGPHHLKKHLQCIPRHLMSKTTNKEFHDTSLVAHTCEPSTWEAGEVQDQLWLNSKFKGNLGYMRHPTFTPKRQKKVTEIV